MTRHRTVYYFDYEGDFGLTGLAGRLCSGTWPSSDAPVGPVLVAQMAAADEDVQLGEDIRLLLESPLPGEVIRTVWRAAVREHFDPTDHSMDMRTWLHEVAEVCPARLPQREGRENAALTQREPVVPEDELRESVLAEITAAAPALTAAVPERGLLPALRQVVREVDADLGFRLFLRGLKAYAVTVEADQYDRLLALGDRLAYPLGAVHEGLEVRWPPPDPGRRDFEFAFGLPGLARLFDGAWDAWRYEGTGTPREHIARLAQADNGLPPGTQAAVLLDDVRRLLDSSLSDDAVTLLWRTAARRRDAADAFDADGRSWLREMAEVCTERLATAAPAYRPFVSPPRTDLTGPALREVQNIAPSLNRTTATGGVAALLEDIVTSIDPDLGFRLLLRVLEAYEIRLTESQLSRYHVLGERFGYHEGQVADAVQELVEHG